MGYPPPFKFGEPSSAPYAFFPHFRSLDHPSAFPPPPPTHCRPAHSTSTRPTALGTPLAAVNGPARSHPLLLQPCPHASRSHNRTLPNAADPRMSCFATSPPSPRAPGSRPAAPPPPAVHVVCTAPLVAPKPLPYHSPTFLHFDLPDDDEDLSHPPYAQASPIWHAPPAPAFR
ncbi:hypothetical protein PHLGIDRAFT_126548 [Phlebiopsis gigantea 11061_1 CR5-6]|uniref:Uncharacterized protein n=1 Tax=Phlebiopsis gigantea (strain 11061_1 CR5-6) TaxID=745531 RepID=A0A0C3NUT4_PHLG1|nr:hypothetical protein PHLGIDRAFT_126548 [Phlebiopsis gigantea 11061_1 CR5-6]